MALPPGEYRKKAFLRLILEILLIDTLAVTGYLVLVHVFGWEGMAPLVLLLVAAVFTGMYFQAGKRRIGF
jgi:CHASE2 domain-containing sensor protein